MTKMRIVKIGFVDEDGPCDWIFDGHNEDGTEIPDTSALSIDNEQTLYGGYTIEELKKISERQEGES